MIEKWKKLYELMQKTKKAAPWQWMSEHDIFGVENPGTGEVGFVSVMGQGGEHYSIAVYLGAEGLYGYWALQEAGPQITAEMVFSIPQLQASFEDRDMLYPEDREQIKAAGFKFRGRQSWPMFRRYQAGFFPWFIQEADATFLIHVLEQTLEVAERFKADPELLDAASEDDYFFRVAERKNKQLKWKDAFREVLPPKPKPLNLEMDIKALNKLKKIAPKNHILEVDLFMSPQPIREGDLPPFYPSILFIVEANSGMILGHEFLSPVPSVEAMWGSIPKTLVLTLVKMGINPGEIRVSNSFLAQLFSVLNEDLGFVLKETAQLPHLDEARDAMIEMLGAV